MLLLNLAISVCGQVTAGFTATPASGCAPLVVAFTNTTIPSSGTTYVWNLGNGTGIITLTNPGTSYLAAGTYTVTLTATNGSASNTATRVITVNPTPIVTFSASDTAICPGVPITFTSTVVSGVAGPVTYMWSSGDGYTSTGTSFTHAFALPGYINISLNVTNAAGCSAILTKPAYIHIFTPPSPLFTASTRHVCHHGGNVTFTSNPAGTPPYIYKWTFGDGSPAAGSANPTHYYGAPGLYTVKLVVTDGHGCMDSSTQPAYINVSTLTAAFTSPDSACIYSPITYMNTSTANIWNYWSYGDGARDSTVNGHHNYTTIGNFTATLVVADSFCRDTSYHILVVKKDTSGFTISPEHPCPSPVTAAFTSRVPAAYTVQWNFGDSLSGSGRNTTHTYMHDTYAPYGYDTVQMIVTNTMGCRDTVTQIYKIYDLDFEGTNNTPIGGCVPLTTQFFSWTHSCMPCTPPLPPYPYGSSSVWDFGDGSPIDSPACCPAHTYTAIGIYHVTEKLITRNGCIRVRYDSIPVGTKPLASVTHNPTHQCYSRNFISFTRTLITGPATSYFWMFGEGSAWGGTVYDTVNAPVWIVQHHYVIPGKFLDTMVAYFNGCPDTVYGHDTIFIDSPMARYNAIVVCGGTPNTVHFNEYSMGDDQPLWVFGDGSTSTAHNPAHVYPADTIYNTMLCTYNIKSGCRDTMWVMINLIKPIVHFSTPDTTICPGDIVLFKSILTSGDVSYYKWLAPGNTGGNDGTTLIDTFNTPGRYTIKLVVTDQHNCNDTLVKTNYMLVAKPVAHYTVTPTSVCWPLFTTFNDISTDQPGTFMTNHVWKFGDSTSAVTGLSTIIHTYSATGTYTATEIVTDNVGCKDTITQTLVSVYRPKAQFSASTYNTCPYTVVSFFNSSAPVLATYSWAFGDGAASTLANPMHAYADSGHFLVRFIVTDPHGCRDTAFTTIVVTKPHAAFTMDDSVSICPPPFVVHFTNGSSGGVSSYWNLGNGSFSSATNPTNFYTAPGYDTVTLVVTNSNGCKDSAVRHVKVYGYAGAFSYSVDSGCAPLRVFFNANLGSISLVASLTWDFSDGNISSSGLSDTITHIYLNPGGFVPKLILYGHTGCADSSLSKDTIRVDAIRSGFRVTPNPVCMRDTMNLVDTSASYWSHITSHLWHFAGDTSTLASPEVTYNMAGIYIDTMKVTDGWGCTATTVKTVTVYALPAIHAFPDTNVCVGFTTLLSDSSTGGVWTSGAPGIANVGSSSGVVTGVAAGTAIITYTLGQGCYTDATVIIDSFPDPGNIIGDTGVCVGSSVSLTDAVAGGVWRCKNSNATISAAGILKGITPGVDTIIYTVTNKNCPSMAIKPVVIFPLPDPGQIRGIDSICKDALITLTDSAANGTWRSGNNGIATIDSITGIVNGTGLGITVITYTTKPDTNGCANFTTFPLTVINNDFTTSTIITLVSCYGGSDGSIAVTVNGGTPPFQYQWSDDSTTSSIQHLVPGTYVLKILEPTTQCTLTDSFKITAPDSISVIADVVNDVCERPNGSINVTASGGTSPFDYQWSNKETGPQITGLSAGKYTVTVTDKNGCKFIYVIDLEDTTCPTIIIHDAISPNGDGVNDTWVIEGLGRYADNTVQVFDKWGDLLFEQTDYKNDWYGIGKNGHLIPDGTYYYLVKLNDKYFKGTGIFKGTLMIKR